MALNRQQAIAYLRDAFDPSHKIPAETLELYLREVWDIEVDLLDQAVRQIVKTKSADSWFPTVGRIREVAAMIVLRLPSESEALSQIAARIAWAKLDEPRPDPPAVHPTVTEALRLVGGYAAFKSNETPSVVRGQFLRLYKEIAASRVQETQLSALALPAPQTHALTEGAPR